MKIIVITNKETCNDKLFSPLTVNGFKNADDLCNNEILNSVVIDEIYSASSICCLQTIYPFCKKYNIPICIENAFYKKLSSEKFNYYNFRFDLSQIETHFPYLKNSINCKYKSSISTSNIRYSNNENNFNNRIAAFLYSITKNEKNQNKNIIINTHLCVANKIKQILSKNVNYNQEIHYL